jgi:HD-GYP domain-containing protein (c-di-GMP phosphodiesterase class II)
VFDAFGAMTKRRPYSDSNSVADALRELRDSSGSHFHPCVVEAFCKLIEEPDRAVAGLGLAHGSSARAAASSA